MQELSILKDIAFSIIFATISAHILNKLKQPLIIAYILSGILIGPSGFRLVTDQNNIKIISEIGLIFLLFIIGCQINLNHFLKLGKNIFILAFLQFFSGAILTFVIFRTISGNIFELLYTSVVLNLSSTLIVVKLLKDKFETDTTAGKITIGILVLQDVFAIVFLAFQQNFSNPELSKLFYSGIYGIGIVFLSFLFSKNFLSKIFSSSSRNPELLLLSTIAWCFLIAATAEKIGLSKEMGALIAGLSISSFPYGIDITTKISGIRDFFVTLFFVSLGLEFPQINKISILFVFIAIFTVFLTRFITMLPFSKVLKIGIRPVFIACINLSQISEFSLVIVSLGVGYGQLTENFQANILISMLVMSGLATYLINYNDKIYSFFSRHFKISFDKEIKTFQDNGRVEILILGFFKEAHKLMEIFEREMPDILSKIAVVDFNFLNKEILERKKVKWLYGDISNTQALYHYKELSPSIIVCTISDMFLKGIKNKNLLLELKKIFPDSKIILMAEDEEYKKELIENGAFEAINPYYTVSLEIFNSIKKALQ